MKIDVEVKVQGAVTAEQADTILLFTKGVSAKNADYLDEIDDPVPVDHSSLCMFRSPFNGKYVIAHWQTGFESFPQNGRYYCTRAIYELPFEKVEDRDFGSLVRALPKLEHFSEKKFGVEPVEIEVAKYKENSADGNDDILKYIWIAIAAGKRLFIRLDKSEECYANSLLESSRLHRLLGALNTLPTAIRSAASLGYSLKCKDAAKIKDSIFAGLWIVAYYPDEAQQDIPVDCISITWSGQSLTPNADYSRYESLAGDLQELSVLIAPETRWSDWKAMCEGVAQVKSDVDNALESQNHTVLSSVLGTSCKYKRIEIRDCLLARLGRLNSPLVADIEFMANHAVKNDNLDKLLGRWLKSPSVHNEVKVEIQRRFGDRKVVIDALKAVSDALPLQEKYASFGSSLTDLTYSDLSLDNASDREFVDIYRGLLSGSYPNVDISQIPGSASFHLKFVKLVISKNNNAIVDDKKLQGVVKDHKLANASLLDWLFDKGYIKTPEQLIAWASYMSKTLLEGLVDRYVEANSSSLTCVDLLKLKDKSKLSFSYKEYIASHALPLGGLSEYCHGVPDSKKDSIYGLLEDRRISTLEEWTTMQSIFGKSGAALGDELFVGGTDTDILKTLLNIYQKYHRDDKVRDYVENKVLSLAEKHQGDKVIKKTISEMCKVNKDFNKRMQSARMATIKGFIYSRLGIKISWGLNVFFSAVIIVLLSMRECSSEKTQGETGSPNDSTIVDKPHHKDSLAQSDTVNLNVADSTVYKPLN